MPHQALINRFRAARKDPQLVVLEGLHALKHAKRFGAEVIVTVVAEDGNHQQLAAAVAPDILACLRAATIVPATVFSQLAPMPHPTGVIAIACRPTTNLAQLLANPAHTPIIVLDRPQRASNVGASIRVAAAAGAAGLVVRGDRDPWSPPAIRAAAGLQFALQVVRVAELPATDHPIIAIDAQARELVAFPIPPRAILVFGSEREGITLALLARADHRWRLPMRPGVSSLNLATAVAAVLYGGFAGR